MKTEVALVLDTDFAQELQAVALRMPVWIVKSAINTIVVKELCLLGDSLQLTEFFSGELESKVNLFYKIVYTLDEHHNELSQAQPYNTLLVYGFDLEDIDENELEKLGFIQFQKTEYGFIARKDDVQ